MAKFRVGERAKFVGPITGRMTPADHGKEVVILGIEMIMENNIFSFHKAHIVYPGQTIYTVDWPGESCYGYIPESELEKLTPKHQPSDLKAADPQFINHQLPSWLKQEEKTHVPEKSKA